jgi:hypothetical protein
MKKNLTIAGMSLNKPEKDPNLVLLFDLYVRKDEILKKKLSTKAN